MTAKTPLFTALIGAALLSSLSVSSSVSAASLLDKGAQHQAVIAGIANEQPYGYIGEDGKATGANVEVLRAILKPLGITHIETPVVDFGALVPGLAAHRFDIIGAGLFINPARSQVIVFSNPVTRSGGAFR